MRCWVLMKRYVQMRWRCTMATRHPSLITCNQEKLGSIKVFTSHTSCWSSLKDPKPMWVGDLCLQCISLSCTSTPGGERSRFCTTRSLTLTLSSRHQDCGHVHTCFCSVLFSRHAAVVISGTELARQIQREIQRDVEELVAQGNMRPHLGVVLVGEDPASRTYVKNKTRAASILGKSFLCVHVLDSFRHARSNQRLNTRFVRCASSVVPCRYFQWHSGAAKLGLPGGAAGADRQDEPWLEGQRPAGPAATSW